MANLAQRATQTKPSGKEGEIQAPAEIVKLNAVERDGQRPESQGRLKDLHLTEKREEEGISVKTNGRGEATCSGLMEAVENGLRDAKEKVEHLKLKGIFNRAFDEGERRDVNEACKEATGSLLALAMTGRLTRDELDRLNTAFNEMNDRIVEKSWNHNRDIPNKVDVESTNRKIDEYEELMARADAALPKETTHIRKEVVVQLKNGNAIATRDEAWASSWNT